MAQSTKGWAVAGFVLIGASFAIYALAILVLGGVAIFAAGPASGFVFLIIGPGAIGFAILLAKVLVDRMNSPEDDYYADNIDE